MNTRPSSELGFSSRHAIAYCRIQTSQKCTQARRESVVIIAKSITLIDLFVFSNPCLIFAFP